MNSDRELTLLVFKDGLTPRTFRVSTNWLNRFAGTLLAVGILTLASVATATYFWYRARHLDASNVASDSSNHVGEASGSHDPSAEILALQNQIRDLQAKLSTPQTGQTIAAPVTSTTTAAAPAGESLLFKALPSEFSSLNAGASLQIQNLSSHFAAKKLQVRFDLQYTGPNGGYQSGRIVILVRGPDTLLAYPDTVLFPADQKALINPEHGEYFSVSRFRETKAEFGPLQNPAALKEIQVLIFNESKQLILNQSLKVAAPPTKPAPAPDESENSESTP